MANRAAYEGNDMASYLLAQGFTIMPIEGAIRSITNVRDTAIIVTDYAIWRAKPSDYGGLGFSLERLSSH